MTAASTLDDLLPGLGQLARALAGDDDSDIVVAAKALDRGALNAFLYPAEPIIVPPHTSGCRKAPEPTSYRLRLAGRLTRLASNPRVDLDRWSRDFIVSAVSTLRADLPLSDAQEAIVKRLFKIPRRRLS